jgi:Antirestriction protein (ArdA)
MSAFQSAAQVRWLHPARSTSAEMKALQRRNGLVTSPSDEDITGLNRERLVVGFSRYVPSEFAELELICAIGAAIVEHGTIITGYLEHVGFPTDAEQLPALLASFSESYQGAYESLEDWAEQYLQETGLLEQVPESFRGYLDLESWADDAELNGEIFPVELEDKTHVFSNH